MESIPSATAARAYHSDEHASYGEAASESVGGEQERAALIAYIRNNVVGDNQAIPTPLGPRKITYVDHTASGRALSFIEGYMQEVVLPVYSNTHTSTSECGWQSHMFLTEARDIVRDTFNASEKDDVVLFTGRGATAASNMLAHFCLGNGYAREEDGTAGEAAFACRFSGCQRTFFTNVDLHMHARTHPDGEQSAWLHAPLSPAGEDTSTTATLPSTAPQTLRDGRRGRPVVLIGPYAHHSSLLPWKERGAHILFVPHVHPSGEVDFAMLHSMLVSARAASSDVFAVFTAVSNITGATVDVSSVTAMCRFFGIPCFWDYAAAAPHAEVDVNPKGTMTWSTLTATVKLDVASPPSAALLHVPLGMDAVYFSTHKFVGGTGAQGVLIMKRRYFSATTPNLPGGGTVFFVREDGTPRYLSNDVEREEGGSPDLIGAVRTGLAIHLYRSVDPAVIAQRESELGSVARARLARHPHIRLVQAESSAAAPILSMMFLAPRRRDVTVSEPSGRLVLHWGFVTAVLNDIFGIQSRGGCLCAGPYAMQLLGLHGETVVRLEEALLRKNELLRPGVVRVSFSYYMSHAAFQFVLGALEWVASYGHLLLHLYSPVHDTGEWRVNRAQAYALLSDGYRIADAVGPTASPLRQWLVEACECSVETSRKVVSASVIGDGAGHLEQAKKGGTRTHPRRWLQDLKFNASGAHWPNYQMRLNLVAVNPDPSQAEYELYEAYQTEAYALVAGILSRPIPSSPHHAPHALLNDFGLPLRWFVTAMDYEVESFDAVEAGGVINLTKPSGATLPEPVSVLASARLGEDALIQWNGRFTPMAEADSAPARVAISPAAMLQASSAKAKAAPRKPKTPHRAAPLSAATAELPTLRVETDFVATHAHSRPGTKATMSEAAYRERARRYAATKAALGALPSPPPGVLTPLKKGMVRAIQDFAMLRDGDRVLVGLSGGKDSLSMLIMLLLLQEQSPVRFDVAACTVDPMYAGFDPSPLKDFLKLLQVPYFYASEPVIDMAAEYMDNDSICAWCSRMKRGILYTTARTHGYNVLALGQHLDDFAESFVMSAFRNGCIRTMKAHYTNDDGDIRIIRPLAYVRERQTREFANVMKLPVINENCPACFTGPTERYHVKKLLATEESTNAKLFSSLCTCMKPLMTDEGARVIRNMSLTADEKITSVRIAGKVHHFPGIGACITELIGQGNPALQHVHESGEGEDDEDAGETAKSVPFFRQSKAYVVNLTGISTTFESESKGAEMKETKAEEKLDDAPALNIFDEE